MIELKNEKIAGGIKLPTSVKEITPEMLEHLTNNVILQKHYVIIALCWKVSLGSILMSNKQNTDAKVISLIAKSNVSDEYKYIKQGDVCIINKSSIEMGTHLYIPTKANMQNIHNYYLNVTKLDNPKATGISMNVLQQMPKEMVYLLEFKIVPVTDIKAVVDMNSDNSDPFNID